MKLKNKFLLMGLIISFFIPSSVFATEEITGTYLWDITTGEVIEYNPDSVQEYPIDESIDFSSKGIDSGASIITPDGLLMEVFTNYSAKSQTTALKGKLVNRVTLTNGGSKDANLFFETTSSGSWSASASTSATGSIELKSIVANVNATMSVGGTLTRTWTKGETYGSAFPVAPDKTGFIDGYIPRVSSSGTAYYDVISTSGDKVGTTTKSVGAMVPSKNSFHFETGYIK